MRARLEARYGLDRSRYEGPTGIVGVFQDACVGAGIPAISFWAGVPHYVAQPPNPKATMALLHSLEGKFMSQWLKAECGYVPVGTSSQSSAYLQSQFRA